MMAAIRFRRVNPQQLEQGQMVLYRASGTGPPRPVLVRSPGPEGLTFVTFLDAAGDPITGSWIAVVTYTELFLPEDEQ
jgi:hypothetical protein